MQTQTFPRSEGTKNKNCPVCFQTAYIALFNYGLLFPRMLNHNLTLIYSIHQLGIGNALNTQANTDDFTQKHSLRFLKIN